VSARYQHRGGRRSSCPSWTTLDISGRLLRFSLVQPKADFVGIGYAHVGEFLKGFASSQSGASAIAFAVQHEARPMVDMGVFVAIAAGGGLDQSGPVVMKRGLMIAQGAVYGAEIVADLGLPQRMAPVLADGQRLCQVFQREVAIARLQVDHAEGIQGTGFIASVWRCRGPLPTRWPCFYADGCRSESCRGYLLAWHSSASADLRVRREAAAAQVHDADFVP